MRQSRIAPVLIFAVSCASPPGRSVVATSVEPARATVAFTNVNLVPMTSDTVLQEMTVLVDGTRIVGVGRTGDLRVPDGTRTIAGDGRWLMPGLADAHGHLVVTIGAAPELRERWQGVNERLLLLWLSRGVTTVLELGGVGLGPDPDRILPEIRADVAAGRRHGPTVYLATAKANDSAMTREQGRQFADSARASGYDLIKVYNAVSREGHRGVTLRARELGLPVVGHVARSMGLEGTLGSGQHGIVHSEEFVYTYYTYRVTDTLQAPEHILDPAALPYLASITRKSGVWVTPTLVTSETVVAQVQNLDAVLARPEVQHIPRDLFAALWAPAVNPYASRFSHPRRLANLKAALDYQRRLVGAMHREGVPLLAGSDAPAAGVLPGYALHDELRNLVDAGLAPFEALAAATRNVAAYLGKDDFGMVEVGRRADLLLLDANPLDDVLNAGRIAGVMVRGQWYTDSDLQALLQRGSR